MKKSLLFTFIITLTLIVQVNGQKKFAQIEELIPTPNEYECRSTRLQLLPAAS